MQSFRFHPAVAQWFDQTFGSPTEPQVRGWPAIHSGRDVLISAPTGSGKTLAAFLASLDALFREGAHADLPDETQLVYVSPLTAFSNDIPVPPTAACSRLIPGTSTNRASRAFLSRRGRSGFGRQSGLRSHRHRSSPRIGSGDRTSEVPA